MRHPEIARVLVLTACGLVASLAPVVAWLLAEKPLPVIASAALAGWVIRQVAWMLARTPPSSGEPTPKALS